MKNKSKKWTEEENALFKQMYPISNKEELLRLFPNRTKNSINIHASIMKLRKFRNPSLTTNCSYLLQDSTEVFYWVGFILADGHISNNRLKIALSNKDYNHIEKLAIKLNTKHSIIDDIKYNGNKYSYISCMDKQNISAFVIKFQINQNKTYNPPNYYNFDDDLMLSMFIGLIDGDGCIKNQTGRKDCVISIKCHASWLNFYTEFHKFLDRYFGLKSKPPKIMNCGYMVWTMADYRIVKGLKKFAIENNLPILNRKWDLIDLSIIPKTERSRLLDEVCKENPNLSIDELAKLGQTTYASARLSKIRVFGKSA